MTTICYKISKPIVYNTDTFLAYYTYKTRGEAQKKSMKLILQNLKNYGMESLPNATSAFISQMSKNFLKIKY